MNNVTKNEKNEKKYSGSNRRANETFFTLLTEDNNVDKTAAPLPPTKGGSVPPLSEGGVGAPIEGGLGTSFEGGSGASVVGGLEVIQEAGLKAIIEDKVFKEPFFEGGLETFTNNFNVPLSEPANSNSLENGTIQDNQNLLPGSTIDPIQKHKFGLFTCIAVVASCIVGSGILAQPQGAYEHTNTPLICVLVWFSYGLVATMGALCYAELGTTLPQFAGEYSYMNEIFGPLFGFLYQWSSIFVIIPVSRAVMSLTIAHNLISPYLDENKCNHHDGISWIIKSVAIGIIVILSILNCMSRSIVSKLNGTLFIVKMVAVSSVMFCGVAFMSEHGIYTYTNFTLAKDPGRHLFNQSCMKNDDVDTLSFSDRAKVSQIAMSVFQVSFSYLGFNHLNFIAEDALNPERNLPLAIFISLPSVVLIYVFVNFTYFVALPGDTIINTEVIIHDVYKAVIPQRVHSATLWMAPTLIVVAVSGSLTSQIISTARIPFMGARNGHLPKFLALVNRKHLTPTPSIAITSLVGIIHIIVNGAAIKTMIFICAYLQNAFILVTIIALIHLRCKQPDLNRPIKLPIIIPVIYVVINVFLFAVPIFTIDINNPKESLEFLGGTLFTVATGIPVYFLIVRRKTKPACLIKLSDKCTVFVGKIFTAVPEQTEAN